MKVRQWNKLQRNWQICAPTANESLKLSVPITLDSQRRFAIGAAHGLAIGNQLRPVAKHWAHQFLDALGYQVLQIPHIGSVHGGILHFGAQQIQPEVRVWKIIICWLDVIGYVY